MAEPERVLVTGESGYIAGFCIAQLLAEGAQVRTTVRTLARAPAVRAAIGKLAEAGDRLAIVAADLNARGPRSADPGQRIPVSGSPSSVLANGMGVAEIGLAQPSTCSTAVTSGI